MSEIIWQVYKAIRSFCWKSSNSRVVTKKQIDTSAPISEVMFFSNTSALCRLHSNRGMPCKIPNCPVAYLRNLVSYLDGASKSIDVCMYFLTCQKLSEAIINASYRGVEVKIITDRRTAHNDDSNATLLYKNGVPIRFQESDGLMHHKFIIVDNTVLINGSLNWTMTAFYGNYENVLITNQPALVKPFVEEFARLWTHL